MARIKRGTLVRARHKKILKKAKGYYGARSRIYRVANQAVMKAEQYSYRDRKTKKQQFRKLWISRINAETRKHGISYNKFIHKLHKLSILINRKILSNLAIYDKTAFNLLIQKIM